MAVNIFIPGKDISITTFENDVLYPAIMIANGVNEDIKQLFGVEPNFQIVADRLGDGTVFEIRNAKWSNQGQSIEIGSTETKCSKSEDFPAVHHFRVDRQAIMNVLETTGTIPDPNAVQISGKTITEPKKRKNRDATSNQPEKVEHNETPVEIIRAIIRGNVEGKETEIEHLLKSVSLCKILPPDAYSIELSNPHELICTIRLIREGNQYAIPGSSRFFEKWEIESGIYEMGGILAA